jgi:regulator of sirC expression with transglutaminase-like and TPR domain
MTRPNPLYFALAFGLTLTAGAAGAQLDTAEQARERQQRAYQNCMTLARAAPAEGLDSALAWGPLGGGDGARHCAAVALIGLGQYRAAAQRLERLSADLRDGDAGLSFEVLVQAGQAWILAGDAGRAHAVQSAALGIDPDNVELLLDRSITLATAGNYWEAVDDLNRALELAPDRPDLLTLRASAYRSLDALALAREDIARALSHAPNDPDALLERGLLRRLAGDEAGARDDWLRVIGLADGSPSAEAARVNLERLGGKVE